MIRKITLQALIVLLVIAVVTSALGITNWLIANDVAESKRAELTETVRTTSKLMAASVIVQNGLSGGDEAAVQSFAEKTRKQIGADYITVFDENGIRKSHPNPDLIGQPFQGGDEGPALDGEEHLSTAEGSLGLSVRYFTPVFSEQGEQIGAVAVGITLEKIQEAIVDSRRIIYAGLAAGLTIGLIGALFLGQRVRKVMFGLEPVEIARLLEERSVMLASTHEGILAVDRAGSIKLLNEAAAALLRKTGLTGPFEGKEAGDLMPHIPLDKVLERAERLIDEELEINGTYFFINSSPLIVEDEIIGAVTTIRDRTEMKKLAERLSGTEMYAEALRVQTHEFMNRLHVILGMVHIKQYDALPTYIQEINIRYQDNIGYLSKRIADPVVAGFLLAKMSFAAEQGKEVILAEESFLPEQRSSRIAHELITILGNLIDNALDATEQKGRPVTVLIESDSDLMTIEVKDHGKGMESTDGIFEKGRSEKGDSRGYGLFLIKESVDLLNGAIYVLSKKQKGTIVEVNIPFDRKE
ncbi:DcuS/MalK family sensor histidine kinase [Domibacillus sp. A3M-37]|uniref:DcuS/MalK family sensor histidine kinase n=1 Tax=Domibacillus sp. A3M-37 TaxID=2962037 RepID=UPI0020B8D7F7|nr:DcuS/MalK family sensor histidine kinase [Domibacillus sp. A3M-37]MCP3761156.1 DcuS/MalK family sensor histidine kinase [Domibacillus sp. A3M-37]